MYIFGRHAVLFVWKHPQRILQTTTYLRVISPIPEVGASRGSATWSHTTEPLRRRNEEGFWNQLKPCGSFGGEEGVWFPRHVVPENRAPLLCEMGMGTSKAAALIVQPRTRHRHVGHGVASQRCSREREEVPTISKAWFAEMLYIFIAIFLCRFIMLNLIKTSSPFLLSLWSSLSP